jgi:hypothetical protein
VYLIPEEIFPLNLMSPFHLSKKAGKLKLNGLVRKKRLYFF